MRKQFAKEKANIKDCSKTRVPEIAGQDCEAAPILHKGDPFPQHSLGPKKPIHDLTDVKDSDFMAVTCKNGKTRGIPKWRGRRREDLVKRSKESWPPEEDTAAGAGERRPLQIMMISGDSQSSNEYQRGMPKSVQLLNEMGAIFFDGHGIVGDGTTANVAGALTGWNELKSGAPSHGRSRHLHALLFCIKKSRMQYTGAHENDFGTSG